MPPPRRAPSAAAGVHPAASRVSPPAPSRASPALRACPCPPRPVPEDFTIPVPGPVCRATLTAYAILAPSPMELARFTEDLSNDTPRGRRGAELAGKLDLPSPQEEIWRFTDVTD